MISNLKVKRNPVLLLLMAILVIVVSSGCTVTLVSKYDEKTENYATDIRNSVDSFLTSLERNEGKDEAKYENQTEFYDNIMVTLRGMQNRAIQIPKNDFTKKQIELLMDTIKKLEEFHKLGNMDQGSIASIREAINSQCGSIIKLEIMKKRNDNES